MANTAVSANSEKARTITFKSKAHKNFYLKYLPECRYMVKTDKKIEMDPDLLKYLG